MVEDWLTNAVVYHFVKQRHLPARPKIDSLSNCVVLQQKINKQFPG